MNHLVIGTLILIFFFVAGMLVMRKHAARIEATAKTVKDDMQKAADSVKSSAAMVNATANAVHTSVVKAATEIKDAIKNQQ